MGVGVAAGTDHVMDAGAELVETVPIQSIVCDGSQGPKLRKVAPLPVAGADMGRMQGSCLAAIEPFRQVVGVPKV